MGGGGGGGEIFYPVKGLHSLSQNQNAQLFTKFIGDWGGGGTELQYRELLDKYKAQDFQITFTSELGN